MFEVGSKIPAPHDPRSGAGLPSDKARTLLRRLRDLNLCTGPVAVRPGLGVVIAGCLSLGLPAEAGVRYLVRLPDGSESRLEIGFREARLALSLTGPARLARDLEVDVTCDRRGRACMPSIGARVSPESTDARELEHFLRRVVRALV